MKFFLHSMLRETRQIHRPKRRSLRCGKKENAPKNVFLGVYSGGLQREQGV